MKEYSVASGQSLFDVAVEAYGDVAGVTWLLADNATLAGPTARIQEGQKLLVRTEAINLRARVYLQDYRTIATISPADQPEGVGHWRLDEYIVQ